MHSQSTSGEQLQLDFGATRSCRGSGQGRVERTCAQCKRTVEVPEWFAQEGIDLHFCSAACRQVWLDEAPPVAVKPGKKYRPRGANWELQSRRARERDAFTCQVCGVTEEALGRQLDVHHRIPFHSFRSNVEANKLEHLISVCPSCHVKLETALRQELPLFRSG
jgi:5-methylcytosine-specific restriction endonuclease McrA